MIEMLRKDFKDISLKDIQGLIKEKVSENYFLEYKRTLSSTEQGESDRWLQDQSKIGEKAKKKIIKEVLAFGNAEGGTLLLGITETESDPPCANKINPIPKPHELAERLKQILRDSIEPIIPNIKIKGIESNEDEGLVLIKIEKSINAPHRSSKDNNCYVRRNDSSEPMTMKEIKDLTLARYHEFDRINLQFEERSDLFKQRLDQNKLPLDYNENGNFLALRTSFIPITSKVNFDGIQNKRRLSPLSNTLTINLNDRREEIQAPESICGYSKPILAV